MNYKEAEKLAQEKSLEYPHCRYYVNWMEEQVYYVDVFPENSFQEYYYNGILTSGDDE